MERTEFGRTPKHGRWLSIAENEPSSIRRRCIRHRRIGDPDTVRREIRGWSSYVNERQSGVDWHMTIDDARSKLKSVYPTEP